MSLFSSLSSTISIFFKSVPCLVALHYGLVDAIAICLSFSDKSESFLSMNPTCTDSSVALKVWSSSIPEKMMIFGASSIAVALKCVRNSKPSITGIDKSKIIRSSDSLSCSKPSLPFSAADTLKPLVLSKRVSKSRASASWRDNRPDH